MVFTDDGKEVVLGEETFLIHKAPATVSYDVAMRYNIAQEKQDADALMKCLYMLLKYVEVVLEDGRKVPLDNQEIINQHIKTPADLLELQKETVSVNFTSFARENR